MHTQHSFQRIFHYQEKPFRTIQLEGEIWFVAADVCQALGLTQITRAMNRLEEDEVRLVKVSHPKNPEKSMTMNAVNEPGLYRLILCSKKSAVLIFSRWITHEVLPALRKTGFYQMEGHFPEPEARPFFSRFDLINLALDAENECAELRGVVAQLAPKAEFFDRVAESADTFSFSETAKMMEIPGFGRNNLIKFLRAKGMLMANNEAIQRYVDRGYFHVVQKDYRAEDGSLRISAVTRVYEKGVDFIRTLLDQVYPEFRERQGSEQGNCYVSRRCSGGKQLCNARKRDKATGRFSA